MKTINTSKSFFAKIILLTLFGFLFLSINACSKDADTDEDADENTEMPTAEQEEETDSTDNEEPPEEEGGNSDDSLTLTTNFVLDKDRKLANLVLTSSDYDKFLNEEGDLKTITNKVYEHFNDVFDFIFVLSVEESQPSGLYYGISYKVKNDIQGIGSSTYNGTAAYGSSGKLKSVIHMPRSEYIRNGPFLHEIAHYWANHGLISSTVGGHWGYSNVGGQLGGFDTLEDLGNNTYQGKLGGDNGFGTFANGGNSLAYGNLELYAMGLIGFDELETIQVAVNPQSTQTQGRFTADAIESISPAALVAQHGDRIPAVQDAQKAFKAITVIISKEVLDQDKIDDINSDLENFSRPGEPDASWGSLYNFWKATYGKASLDIQIADQDLK